MATKKVVETTKVEKTASVKVTASKNVLGALEVTAFDLTGKETGSVALSEDIFGAKVNKDLLSQAMRVYSTNRQSHHGHTKTRGEVMGSTRKMGPQKGSGHARHGSIMSPIYVGGGIALGPRMRKVELDLPKKMRQAALISALAQKHHAGQILGLLGLEKSSGKTSEMAKLVAGIGVRIESQKSEEEKKKSRVGRMLIVTGDREEKVARAAKNLQGVDVMAATQLNVFEVIAHRNLLVTKDAIDSLTVRFNKEITSDAK